MQQPDDWFYYFIEQKLTDGTWVRTGDTYTSFQTAAIEYKKLTEAPFAPKLRLMMAQEVSMEGRI